MPVLMFNPQFHQSVERGQKTQTIRPPRKRPVKVGDTLSLRAWSGAPYRSSQRILRTATCTAVDRITIDAGFCDDAEALRDGFSDAEEMRAWFASVHGLPFAGDRIAWE